MLMPSPVRHFDINAVFCPQSSTTPPKVSVVRMHFPGKTPEPGTREKLADLFVDELE
jgi:hypothetical protein